MAKMKHPDSDRVLDVEPDRQAQLASQGWVRVDGKTTPDPK